MVHDNKKAGLPRLSVARLADGVLEAVEIRHPGLAGALDLECLFRLPRQVTQEAQDLFVAMTSDGHAFLFKVGGQVEEEGEGRLRGG